MQIIHLFSLFTALVAAHGTIRSITGANGVVMPGLNVQDGTPRDCSSNRCGAQADTAIIRAGEVKSGKASPLGRTQGGGPVKAADMISEFMGTGGKTGGKSGTASSASNAQDAKDGTNTKRQQKREDIVAKSAGAGAKSGLPTVADDGTITMTFYQVNQDGAGPLTAAIDPTSGGTDAGAFKNAKVVEDVPGRFGLSGATNREIPVKVAMPAGMTCQGTVAGVKNVCIVRVANGALAGPFGGSAAFTQSSAGRKRSIEYALLYKKRGLLE